MLSRNTSAIVVQSRSSSNVRLCGWNTYFNGDKQTLTCIQSRKVVIYSKPQSKKMYQIKNANALNTKSVNFLNKNDCAISVYRSWQVWVKYLRGQMTDQSAQSTGVLALFCAEKWFSSSQWQPSAMNNRSQCHIMKSERNESPLEKKPRHIRSTRYLWAHVNRRIVLNTTVATFIGFYFAVSSYANVPKRLRDLCSSSPLDLIEWYSNESILCVTQNEKTADDIDDIDLAYFSIATLRNNKIDWILWVHQLVWQLTVVGRMAMPAITIQMQTEYSYFTQSGVYYNRDRHHTEMFSFRCRYDRIYQQENISTEIEERTQEQTQLYTHQTVRYGGLAAPCIALYLSVCVFGSVAPNKWINQSDNRVKLMSTLATYNRFSSTLKRKSIDAIAYIKSGQSFIKSI